MASPTIHTYHCACTSLLIASTHLLTTLPRRAPPCLDQSMILPLPSDASGVSPVGNTSLLSMTPERRATIIRREDGFEKRYLWRCGRCRIVVGYELDQEHYRSAEAQAADHSEGEGQQPKILYVLPGWILGTELMAAGKKLDEREAAFGTGRGLVAAYE